MATAPKSAPKATAKPKKAAPSVDKRIDALEKRITQLEEHDLYSKAGGIYNSTSTKVKESYDENPGLTIVIGLGILVVLLLIIT